jgi:HPt (histidine-containing phosphotransfer) domain-containing protein
MLDDLPDSLPGFDLEEGLTRLQGNRKLYKKLLAGFATTYATAVDDIQSAVDKQDWEQAQHRAHDIKGLAGNLAAKQLHTSAAEFEKLLKTAGPNDSLAPEDIDQKFEAMAGDFTRALEAVQKLEEPRSDRFEQTAAENGDTLPPDLAQKVADRIRNAVEIGDVTQLITISDDLISWSDAYAPYSEKIARMADDFDFDGLLELADNLTG